MKDICSKCGTEFEYDEDYEGYIYVLTWSDSFADYELKSVMCPECTEMYRIALLESFEHYSELGE